MLRTKDQFEHRIRELEAELAALVQQDPANDRVVNSEYSSDVLERFLAANSIAMNRSTIGGQILEVNDALVDLLGYGREEMLSGAIRWNDITPSEFKHVDDKAIRQLLEGAIAPPFEKEFIAKDGRRIPVLLSVCAVKKDGSDCFCFIIDLTDQKQKEAALRKSEQQFRLLADAMPQIVYILDGNGKSEYFNQRWYQITGRPVEPPGFEDRWHEVFHPDDVPAIGKAWAEAMTTGEPFMAEGRLINKDGHYFWILVRSLPIRDSSGKVTKWFGTSTDIDAQKRAEAELRASETAFRTLADAIPHIVWTANSTGEIDFFNHRWLEYTGLTIEQSLNDGWQLLIHPDDLPGYLVEWTHALQTGSTYERTFRLKRVLGIKSKSGNPYRRHLGRAVPLRGKDERIMKWFATWTEIEHQSDS